MFCWTPSVYEGVCQRTGSFHSALYGMLQNECAGQLNIEYRSRCRGNPCAGELFLDQGAVDVLQNRNASLLPIGVQSVTGQFSRGEVVACIAPDGQEVARGLVNYSTDECKRIVGKPSKEIAAILGYDDDPELINRENLILT